MEFSNIVLCSNPSASSQIINRSYVLYRYRLEDDRKTSLEDDPLVMKLMDASFFFFCDFNLSFSHFSRVY